MIAALFVERGGVYWDLPGVDPWDRERDARLYHGPHPVVAHPPCGRWGRMAKGAFGRQSGKPIGADDGCFASALSAVRAWGGVIEHPAHSAAWRAFALNEPVNENWIPAGDGLGFTAAVEQGHYGHRTRKATWLYARARALPKLASGESRPDGYEPGRRVGEVFTRLSKRQRAATPLPFRDLLLLNRLRLCSEGGAGGYGTKSEISGGPPRDREGGT